MRRSEGTGVDVLAGAYLNEAGLTSEPENRPKAGPQMDEIKDRVRYVPRHIPHHGLHSGYDRLFVFMGLREARSAFWAGVARTLPKSLRWRLWAMRPQSTQQQGLEAEFGAVPWVARGGGRLCHFIYGEDTFFYTPLWKNGANKVIATFHYPPDRLTERVNPGSLRALDGVVIVGESQRDWFRRYFPDARIHHCRHQVDTGFFRPGPAAGGDGTLRMVCVGHLFRDYAGLLRVHRMLQARGLACETHIVGPAALRKEPIAAAQGVHVHSGMSDDMLLRLYQSSAVGVLPLHDATANNALLEMMACGLPVVVSAVGSVPDYVAGSAVRLIADADPGAFVDQIVALHEDAATAAEEGRRNREFAVETLGDPVVASAMWRIYSEVLDQ